MYKSGLSLSQKLLFFLNEKFEIFVSLDKEIQKRLLLKNIIVIHSRKFFLLKPVGLYVRTHS